MTTPAPKFDLFYTVQFTPINAASGWCEVVPKYRNAGGSNAYRLDQGTYQVAVSWDGPEAVSLNARREGVPGRIAELPTGEGPRDSRLVTVVVAPGEVVDLLVWRTTGPSRPGTARGALRIIRQPEPGEM